MFKAKKKQPTTFWSNVWEFTSLLIIVFLIRTFGFGLYQVPTGSMETTMLVGERFFADKFTPLFWPIKRGDIIAFNDPTYNYSDNVLMYLVQQYVWGPSNWTKRVIGIPGDTIKGVVENGKPLLYLNGVKLEEPYINKYPLIQVFKEDPTQLQLQATQEITQLIREKNINPELVDMQGMYKQYLFSHMIPKSYDPSKAYDEQPFYRIDPACVVKDEKTGKPILVYPGTPIREVDGLKEEKGNYWNGTDDFYVELGANQYWAMGDNRLGSRDCRFFGPIVNKLIHAKIVFRIWSIDSSDSWWIVDLIKHPIDFWSRVRWKRFFQFIH